MIRFNHYPLRGDFEHGTIMGQRAPPVASRCHMGRLVRKSQKLPANDLCACSCITGGGGGGVHERSYTWDDHWLENHSRLGAS